MLGKAFVVALKAHKGQKDKAGKPYILHPINVAMGVKEKKEKTVALLHDVVEDTCISIADLEQMGFDNEILEAVAAITKTSGETYLEYLERVNSNDIAKKVKIADLTHNSKLKRLKNITQKDIARSKKYESAIEFLCSRNELGENA